MNLLDSINQFLRLFLDTFRQLGRGSIWLPLIGYFAVQWLVLFAHYDFLSPLFYDLVSRWTALFDPHLATAFGHYPEHFLLLGRFAGWAKLGVGLLLEGLVLGLVAGAFHHRFAGVVRSRSLLDRWPDLVLVWLVINGLMVAAGILLPNLLAPVLTGPRRLLAFSFVFMPLVYTLILSLFFVAIPNVAVRGLGFFKALVGSIGLFFRRPFTLFSMAGFILVIPALLGALASRPSDMVESFKPELVYWLLTATLFCEMVAYFFWMGTAVRFLSEEEA